MSLSEPVVKTSNYFRAFRRCVQCSLYDAQTRGTTWPFAQWNLTLAHLQHSKFKYSIFYRIAILAIETIH